MDTFNATAIDRDYLEMEQFRSDTVIYVGQLSDYLGDSLQQGRMMMVNQLSFLWMLFGETFQYSRDVWASI